MGERFHPHRTETGLGRLAEPPAILAAILAARGVTAATLRGRTIRVRGILEEWQGTAITVTAAETVEVLEAGRGRR